MHIIANMRVHQLVREQLIPAPLGEVWSFFSNPHNLLALTPGNMKLTVTSGSMPPEVYAGLIISYKVSPLPGIRFNWLTTITDVQRQQLFIDDQTEGPFRYWRHEHRFDACAGGVLMTDTVHYRMPLGVLGKMAHAIFIKREIEDIFEFRRRKISALWPASAATK